MREIIDNIPSTLFNPLFKKIFQKIQRDKKLTPFVFQRTKKNIPSYLMPVDATGYFSSEKIYCESCLVSNGKNDTKKNLYQHKMLAAAIVHPNVKTVIPIAPEPIIKQDGTTKNDCEFNAFKRFVVQFRKDYPKLKVVMCGDALYAKGALVKVLQSYDMSYILNVKPDGNPVLFKYINGCDGGEERDYVKHYEYSETIGDKIKKNVTHKFRYKNKCPIDNKSSTTLQINFLEYWELTEWINLKGEKCEKKRHFSWATDIVLNKESILKVMKGGRARWHIENQVFNTLKNQGYQFEHNFGHGRKNLSTNFSKLMMLAFYMDQVQEMACPLFIKLLAKMEQKSRVWERIKMFYKEFKIESWEQLISILANKQGLVVYPNST